MDKTEWQALNLISFCRNFIAGFFYVFVPLYMLSAHLPLADIGIAIGVATLIRLLSAPFIGTLNDLTGTRHLIQLSLLGMAVGAAAMGATRPESLTLAVLLLPLALFWTANNALILSLEASLYKKTTSGQVAGHMGEYQAIKALAWGGGIALSGYLLLLYPFGAIAMALAAFALLVMLPAFLVKHTVPVRFSLSEYARELRKPPVLLLCLLIFIMSFEWGVESVALPLIYARQAGLDTGAIGLVVLAANVVYAGVAFWVGRQFIARHLRLQARLVWRSLAAGMLACALASILLFLSHDFAGAMAARMLENVGEGIISIGFGFLIGTLFSSERVGGVNGAMNLVSGAGISVAAFASGALMGFGLGVPYLLAGSFFLVGAVISWQAQGLRHPA